MRVIFRRRRNVIFFAFREKFQVTCHILPHGQNISPAKGGYHREAISHFRGMKCFILRKYITAVNAYVDSKYPQNSSHTGAVFLLLRTNCERRMSAVCTEHEFLKL